MRRKQHSKQQEMQKRPELKKSRRELGLKKRSRRNLMKKGSVLKESRKNKDSKRL